MVIGVIIVSYSVGRGPWHGERATTETKKFQSDRGKSNLEKESGNGTVCVFRPDVYMAWEVRFIICFRKNGEPKSRLRTDGFDVFGRSGGSEFRSK